MSVAAVTRHTTAHILACRPLPQGLPFPNITSVARDFGSLPGVGSVPDMWVGTGQGVARFSPANRECISASNPSAVGDWVYYWGRRWLPGNNITWVSSHENTTYVGGCAHSVLARYRLRSPPLLVQAPTAAWRASNTRRGRWSGRLPCLHKSYLATTAMGRCTATATGGSCCGLLAVLVAYTCAHSASQLIASCPASAISQESSATQAKAMACGLASWRPVKY